MLNLRLIGYFSAGKGCQVSGTPGLFSLLLQEGRLTEECVRTLCQYP